MIAMQHAPAPAKRRRPFALTILAGLMAFKAVVLGLVALGLGAGAQFLGETLHVADVAVFAQTSVVLSVVVFAAAAVLGLCAFGLLTLRPSGWRAAMVVTGILVALDIVGFLAGAANHVWMFLNIVTVFYLNQQDVRAVFGAAGSRAPEDPS